MKIMKLCYDLSFETEIHVYLVSPFSTMFISVLVYIVVYL